MGFRSRARARRQGNVNTLGSTRDVRNSILADDASDGDSTDSTILGVVLPEPEDVVPVTTSDVPEGTTNEIKDWVGDDVERARVALEVESANAKPRKGLVSHLEELVGVSDDE